MGRARSEVSTGRGAAREWSGAGRVRMDAVGRWWRTDDWVDGCLGGVDRSRVTRWVRGAQHVVPGSCRICGRMG